MPINSVGACASSRMQATQYSSKAAGGTGRPAPQDPGEFISAIASTLGELDVGTASAADGTGAATALGDFLGSLMEALKAQDGQGGARPPPPPQGSLQAGLQSLIGDLGSPDADSASAALTASFASLLSALGLDSSAAGSKLGEFLDKLATRLDASGPSGNVINTTA